MPKHASGRPSTGAATKAHNANGRIPAPRPRALPGRWVDLARDGDTTGRYTRHAAGAAFMCAAARAGLTYTDVESIIIGGRLFDDTYRTRDNGRPRSLRSALVKARRDWDRAVRHVADTPPATTRREATQRLATIRAAADTTTWTGRAATRNRTVLRALHTISETLGTLTPRVSIRTLTEDTPYRGHKTIARALDDLETLGWIQRQKPGPHATVTTYRLRAPSKGVASDTRDRPSLRGTSCVRYDHPSTALGLTLSVHAATIHTRLTGKPMTRNDMARATGYAPSTCGKWLTTLTRHKLATRTTEGWTAGPADPDQVATDLGADDIIEARAERHQQQRANHQKWLHHRQKGKAMADTPNRRRPRTPRPQPAMVPGLCAVTPELLAKLVDADFAARLTELIAAQQRPAPNNVTPITRATR